jgi:hypothetical protein
MKKTVSALLACAVMMLVVSGCLVEEKEVPASSNTVIKDTETVPVPVPTPSTPSTTTTTTTG